MNADMQDMVETMERATPEPMPVPVEASLDGAFLTQYADAARFLGYAPQELEQARFRAFCAERGIPTYDRAKVKAYLDQKYGGPTRYSERARRLAVRNYSFPIGVHIDGEFRSFSREEYLARHPELGLVATWGWRPITEWRSVFAWSIPDALNGSSSDRLIGVVFGGTGNETLAYTKPIPAPVLLRAVDVKQAFPSAVFLVSDEHTEADIVAISDPFLGVLIDGAFFIIDKWDEPGFRG